MGIVISAGDPDFLPASLHAELAQRPRVDQALASELPWPGAPLQTGPIQRSRARHSEAIDDICQT